MRFVSVLRMTAALMITALAQPMAIAETRTSDLPPECRPVTLRVDGFELDGTDCHYGTGHWHVEVEPALPGLSLWRDNDRIATVLQTFAKGVDQEISAILPALRQQGHIPDDEECRFAPAHPMPLVRTRAAFEIRPVGERLRRFMATPADQIPDPPCGTMGWSTHGVRYFITDLRRPDRVIYINEGQDGTQINPRTLRSNAQ